MSKHCSYFSLQILYATNAKVCVALCHLTVYLSSGSCSETVIVLLDSAEISRDVGKMMPSNEKLIMIRLNSNILSVNHIIFIYQIIKVKDSYCIMVIWKLFLDSESGEGLLRS